MRRFALALLLLCASALPAQKAADGAGAGKSELPDCDDLRVAYTPIDPQFAQNMVVETTSDPRPQGTPKESPQHTRWVLAVSPDYSKAGPWTTTIWFGDGDDKTTGKLTLRDHEGFSIEWLNEKLLYGSVAWGRIVNTVFIFDVENQKFLYREMENSGALTQPCD